MTTNIASTPSLISTMIVLTFADSLAPRISSSAHITIRRTAGRLTMPGVSSHGAAVSDCGSCQAEQVVQQLVQVAAPADRDRGDRDAVLEQQACRHTHRDELAHRRVGVRVRRARNRYRRRHFRVADGGQAGRDAGDDERDEHRGAGFGHRLLTARRRCRCRRWRRRRTSSAGTCRYFVSGGRRRRARPARRSRPAPQQLLGEADRWGGHGASCGARSAYRTSVNPLRPEHRRTDRSPSRSPPR